MPDKGQHKPSRSLLVVMPTWLGDCVMATPTLRALRELYPDAKITALMRHNVRPILDGLTSIDRLLSVRPKKKPGTRGARQRRTLVGLGRRLSRGGFDTAVLLPNSFKSAALASVAGIPRRVGYDRDGRGVLLTDRLIARRHRGQFVPVPTLDYYLGIARYLGSEDPCHAMELATRPESDARALACLTSAGFDVNNDELLLINPGAQKTTKRWPAQRFGQLIDEMNQRFGVKAAVTGSPAEREILDQVIASAKSPVIDLPRQGMDLHLLKSIMRWTRLMVTNDTGPRHIAAAMRVPVATLFGPTTPAWTQIGFDMEQHIIAGGLAQNPDGSPAASGPLIDTLPLDQACQAAASLYERTQGCTIGPAA